MSQETVRDRIAPAQLAALAATLDRDAWPAGSVPPLAHWLSFQTPAPASRIGTDGHPDRRDFAPAVDLPRRMWAGSTIDFIAPLPIVVPLDRTTRVESVERKEGRSGTLLFVTLHHVVEDGGRTLLSERQDIVYRAAPAGPAAASAPPTPAPDAAQWRRMVTPDPVLLFRYSALTFNAHRIHYDRDYATQVEGYAGLVVHGPLIATLLLHELLARHPGIDVARYRFRAIRPIVDTAPFFVCGTFDGDTAHLFASDAQGALCMDATATLR